MELPETPEVTLSLEKNEKVTVKVEPPLSCQKVGDN